MTTEMFMTLVVGLATGLHSASWGMYKDAPHEGFTWGTYVRSPIVAVVMALALIYWTEIDPTTGAGVLVLFGVTYGLERFTLEVYKGFIRVEDQSKYTIPMQFAVGGKVVESAPMRWAAGAAYVALGLTFAYAAHRASDWGAGLPLMLTIFLVGSAGGWISAVGGAWKDAPIEGFQIFKFFRSPGISFMYGVMMAFLTTEYFFVFVGAIGYTVASIETYKTFFFPNRPRGKFQGKDPLFPDLLTWRHRFVPLFVLVWVGVLAAGAMALRGDLQGLIP
jgi:hypothetical protein